MPEAVSQAQALLRAVFSLREEVCPPPEGLGQFYEFISNAHGLRSKLTAMDVKHLLVNEGFGDKYASYLADVYSHGRDIIKVYRGSVPHGATDRWAT